VTGVTGRRRAAGIVPPPSLVARAD